jgi:hypothetical protein
MTRKEIEQPMDALARKFAATHDMKAKAEIDRWNSELVKLDRPVGVCDDAESHSRYARSCDCPPFSQSSKTA